MSAAAAGYKKVVHPERIPSTYQLHKRNCRVIHRWVHTIVSRKHVELAQAQLPSGSKKKLKAQSRRSGKPQQSETNDVPAPPYTFETFTALVCDIASGGTTIPKSLLTLLTLTIKQRKAIASLYSINPDDWTKIESHRRVIELYQEALEILEQAYRTQSGEKNMAGPTIASDDNLKFTIDVHRISRLILREEEAALSSSCAEPDDEQNEWVRDALRPKSKPKVKGYPLEAYEVHPDSRRSVKAKNIDPDDEWLALQCFIFDVDRIRKHVASIWRTVIPLGKTSQITASYVTNHAVVMVKELEHDFTSDFPQFKNIQKTQSMLSSKLMQQLVQELYQATIENFYSVNDKSLGHAFIALNAYADILKQTPPILKDGLGGEYDPLAYRESMPPTEKVREDMLIVCTWLPDIYAMYKYNTSISRPGYFYGDFGFVRDIKSYLIDDSHPQTWSLLFSCQVMLDTVHARRRVLQDDVNAMRRLGLGIIYQIRAFINDGVEYDNDMSDRRALAPMVGQSVARMLVEDPVSLVKLHHGWDKISKSSCQADSMWYFNPWYTANAMVDAMMDSYMLSLDSAYRAMFMTSAMHLWNMLKQLGHVPKANTATNDKGETKSKKYVLLMDHLIEVYGFKVFSGDPPTERFAEHFDIMTGARPNKPGANGEKKKFPNGPTVIPLDSPVWEFHHNGFMFDESSSHPALQLNASNEHPLSRVQSFVESEIRDTPGPGFNGPMVNLNMLKVHELCFRLFSMLITMRVEIQQGLGEPVEKLFPRQFFWPFFTVYLARSGQSNAGFNEELLEKTVEIVQKVVGTREVGQYLISEDPKNNWKKW